MISLHDKAPVLLAQIERLNLDELYGAFAYDKRRLHFCHQANVFLLGLYIYHNFEPLRKQIEMEMQNTTVVIPRVDARAFRYSGADEYGEFLYRWRLASLCHDIGTGVQLCEGQGEKIAKILQMFQFRDKMHNIDSLFFFGKHNLLADLDKASGNVRLSKYLQYQECHPYLEAVHHDHGIIGSLIFLQLMHRTFELHRGFPVSVNTEGSEVFWHPEILKHSITQIGVVISLHNFGKYPEALTAASKEPVVFNLYANPLAWLLKVADVLQEWDKPKLENVQDQEKLETELKICFTKNEIRVENFPKDKKDETKKGLDCISHPEIVKFV